MNKINWDLTLKFATKDQRNNFIRLLIEDQVPFSFGTGLYQDEDTKNYSYIVEINDAAWSRNLIQITEYLKKVDYEYLQ